MKKIAIIGPINCFTKKHKIKDMLFKMKQKLNLTDFLIVSGGNDTGIEFDVKNIALDFGLLYKEFTPAYSPKNEYSIQPDTYFGKKYHYSYVVDKYQRLEKYSDVIVFGMDDNSNVDPIFKTILSKAVKKNKKVVFI